MYQIVSQSVRFYRLYIKNILVCFFGSQCITTLLKPNQIPYGDIQICSVRVLRYVSWHIE